MGLRALPFTAALVLGACSTGRQPAPSTTGPRTLRGYILVVPMRDLLDSTLANLLRRRGFRVWPDVRGGSGPAAALVSFTFRDASSESTGATVAAASVPLDTLPNDARLHAQALVQALLAEPAPSPPP